MSSDSDDGASSAGGVLRFVTCELSSLSECRCSSSAGSGSGSSSSSKRKAPSCKRPPAPADLSPATAKRVLLPPAPTVIDRLLSESRTALMEGRRSTRSTPPAPPPAATSRARHLHHHRQQQLQQLGKRKKQDKLDNGTSPAVKRLRASKTGSESDSSPSRNGSTERKSIKPTEKIKKKDKNVSNKTNMEDKNLPTTKKVRKHGKSRFSKRICFSTSSLRSGKKRTELLNKKRIVKGLSKDSKKKKRKRRSNDKTDSNSNVCTENDSNDETVDNSTDSEVSRGPSDFPDSKETDINQQDLEKKKRKRRKRDSMWVKKVKKQLKLRSESHEKSLPPPALEPFTEIIIKKDSEASEELPILDKESDDSLNLDFTIANSCLNMAVQDDVPMPMLEKEVEIIVASTVKTIDSNLPLREDPSKNKTTSQENLVSNDTSSSCKENIPNNSDKNKPSKFSSVDITTNLSPTKTNDHTKLISPKDNDESTKLMPPPEKNDSMESSRSENENLIALEPSVKDNPTELHLFDTENKNELCSSDLKDRTEAILPEVNHFAEHGLSEEFKQSEISLSSNDKPNELCLPVNELQPEVSCPENNEPKKTLSDKNTDLSFSIHDEPIVPEMNTFEHVSETKMSEYPPDDSSNNQGIVLEEMDQDIPQMKEDACDNQSESISKPDDNLDFNIPDTKLLESNDATPEISSQGLSICNSEQSQTNTLDTNDCNIVVNTIHPKEHQDIIITHNHENPSSPQVSDEVSVVKDKFVSSAQNLEDEITKLEAVLSGNSDSESKYDESITNKDMNIEIEDIKCSDIQIKAELVMNTDSLCESPDKKFVLNTDSKGISLLDADSTSDMKPQNLDDSFSDFSLCLPDDLELESSPSDDDREEEMDFLPDSTECEQSEEQPKETPSYEVGIPEEPLFTEMSSNLKEEAPSETFIEGEITNVSMCKIETMDTSEIDISETTILKQEFSEASLNEVKPLAGSTPRRLSTETENEQRPIEIIKKEVLTVEQRQMKESVLQALGLKSLSSSPQPTTEEKPKRDGYTGTLKAVIKLNRTGDKKNMVYKRSEDSVGAKLEYRICSEIPATDGVPITHLNDIARIRKNASKTHNESDTNFGTATSNGHSDDHESNPNYDESKNASVKDLIIPEKSSSFSIHPGRLCSDVCNYCFGKFGCLDTPCHVAALKPDRQKKILENELHLTAESCLCDKCYRHVDKKANFPSKTTSGGSSKPRVRPPASSHCCIKDCQEQATNTVKKKWLIKLKKSITNKLDIDIDKPGAMYFPLCTQHHYWVDYFTVCGICRKRLNRNHLFSLGSETDRLNLMLAEDGIPARLSDKLFLCKLCRYYSNLRLKYSDPGSIPSGSQIFYRDYRRKILASLNLPISDSEDEPIVKDDKKNPSTAKKISEGNVNSNNGASASSKSDESVMALSNLATLLGDQPEQQARIQVKFGNVNIGRLSNLNIGQSGREERLPYSEVGLQANLEFEGPSVPDGSWERCVSTLQFDKRTKKLWQDLQKPYGSQSSFLRHLVMLEKYWRAGHLTLTSNADERAAKYLNGVKNRIKAFEGSPSGSGDKQPPATVPLATTPAPTISNSEKFPLLTNTGEIEVTPISMQKRPTPTPVPFIDKRPMTYLDRAKALVRMVPPSPRQRFPMPIQRFQVPVYVPTHNYLAPRPRPPPQQQRPPPLMKIVNKGLSSVPYYTHQLPPYSPHQGGQPLKPILPKLPSALTVTQVPQGGAAITLNRSGITIEKQSGSTPPTPTLPIEKPSISVFREPAPGPP